MYRGKDDKKTTIRNMACMIICTSFLQMQPTSKTTVINDPTAGMSSEEITNYISNVGGGMCGYPESVRTAIGLALNLSLIFFGIATVSYGKHGIIHSD